jgi:hypothetical protein
VSQPKNEKAFLWITAIPGAGKTTLASFLIIRHLALGLQDTFYFFFNSTDNCTNTALCAGKCLLYQLYMNARKTGKATHVEFENAIDDSGGGKAKSFEKVWNLVTSYAACLVNPIFILDALDEAVESDLFLNALLQLLQGTSARIFLTSRPSALSPDSQSKAIVMDLGRSHQQDIEAYINIKTEQGLVSLPEVRSSIIRTLAAKNDGMFLWVRLVLEELESRHTVEEMQEALKSLPSGLDGVYLKILENLNQKLKQSQKQFCHKVLVWLFCARRPLQMEELFEAMKAEYANDGFLYNAQTMVIAIRKACGPLITIRADSIHLLHFSLREFLAKSQAGWSGPPQSLEIFRMDTRGDNLQVLKRCLTYLTSSSLSEKFLSKKNPTVPLEVDIGDLKREWPLLEYSAFNWSKHAWISGIEELPTLQALRTFFDSWASIIWISVCLMIDETTLEPLRRTIKLLGEPLQSNSTGSATDTAISENLKACSSWCTTMSKILFDYGTALEDNPLALFDLDLSDVPLKLDFHPAWSAGPRSNSCRRALRGSFSPRPQTDIPAQRQLHLDILDIDGPHSGRGYDPGALGFFHYSSRFDAFIYANYFVSEKHELLIQERPTGRMLAPMVCHAAAPFISNYKSGRWYDGGLVVLYAAISNDQGWIALTYGAIGSCSFFTCLWRIDERLSFAANPFESQWAEVAFHETTLQPIFDRSAALLRFVGNEYLWFPGGRLDLGNNSVVPYAITMPPVPENGDGVFGFAEQAQNTQSLSLYGDGEVIIFNRDGRKREENNRHWYAVRLSTTGTEIGLLMPPGNIDRHRRIFCGLTAIDERGRFMLWMDGAGKRNMPVLHDSMTGKHVTIRDSSSIFTNNLIVFSPNGQIAVFACYTKDRLDLRISTWDLTSAESPPKRLATRAYRENLCGMCVSADSRSLYLVTTNRVVTQLNLPDLLEINPYLGFNGKFSDQISTYPSNDGCLLASVRFDKTG